MDADTGFRGSNDLTEEFGVKLQLAMLAAVAMAGCQPQAKPPAQTARSTVLDVVAPRPHQPSVYAMSTAAPASYAAQPGGAVPAYLPPRGSDFIAPAAPAIVIPPPTIAPASVTAAVRANAAARAKLGNAPQAAYVVQPGDTLFRIARAHYGSGAAWHKIALANPGLTPATLKAGQKLVLPG